MNSILTSFFTSSREAADAQPGTDADAVNKPLSKPATYPRKGRVGLPASRPSDVSEAKTAAAEDKAAPEAASSAQQDLAILAKDVVTDDATREIASSPQKEPPTLKNGIGADDIADETDETDRPIVSRAASVILGSESVAAAAPTEDAPSAEADSTEDTHSFKQFVNHRWADDAIEIQVEWFRDEPTWEPEATLQRDAAQAVFDYWARQGGRPPHPKDPELYTVFEILGHSGDRKRLKVQWTGFGPDEATWEQRRMVEETAPAVAEAYWERVRAKNPRAGRGGRARGQGRGRGRGRGRKQ